MGKFAEFIKGQGKGDQAAVDSGQRLWDPSMLENDVAPRMGSGTRPANMPAWAKDALPAIQAAYDPQAAAAADMAAALRAAPAAPAVTGDVYRSGVLNGPLEGGGQ